MEGTKEQGADAGPDGRRAVRVPSSAEETLRRLRPSPRGHAVPVEEIARGGMGAVLRVRDEILLRDLAMKRSLLDEGAGAGAAGPGAATPRMDSAGVRRFLQEAQVTAQLYHPGVVPVHELGIDAEGRLFFTMDLVRGSTLGDILPLAREGREGWTLSRAVQVFLRLCETMAFAHSRGVIHRDLKPANVMVGSFGEVYAMDWGLAKVLGSPSPDDPLASSSLPPPVAADGRGGEPLTVAGTVLGTPPYMPPEQARGLVAELDARGDVYSLGAMLYHLLAGCPPYMHGDDALPSREVLARLRAGPPPPIREIRPGAPPELEAVAEKAMAREPADRYASAGEMAEDLHRFLEGRVVRAHRTGPVVELRKWVGRNRAVAALLAAMVTLATGGSVAFGLHERAASVALGAEKREAEAARAKAQAAERVAREEEARAREQAGIAEGNRLAAQAYLLAPREPDVALLLAAEASSRAPGAATRDALYLALSVSREVRTMRGHDSYCMEVLHGAGGRLLASREWGSLAILWDAETGALLHRLDGHDDDLTSLAFDLPGERLATASHDGTARVWSVATGRCLAVVRGHGEGKAVAVAAFSPDGRHLATASDDGTARLWDARTGAEVRAFAGHGGPVHWIEFHRSGETVATASLDGRVRVFDAATGELRLAVPVAEPRDGRFPRHRTAWPEFSVRARWSPDGTRLLAVHAPAFTVLDAGTGEVLATHGSRGSLVRRADWHPSGTSLLLAVAGTGGRPSASGIWDIGARAFAVEALESGDLAFLRSDAGGRRLFAARLFSTVATVHSAEGGRKEFDLVGHTYQVADAVVLPGGRRLATAGCDGTVRLWDIERDDHLPGAAGGGGEVRALSADGRRALRTRGDARSGAWWAEVMDTATGEVLEDLGPANGPGADGGFADGDRLVYWMASDGPRVRGSDPPREIPLSPDLRRSLRNAFALSPDGTRLAGVPHATGVAVHRLADPGAAPLLLSHRGCPVPSLAWSPDGTRLLTANEKATTASVWNATTGKETVLSGHEAWVYGVAWSPDGRRVATSAMDQSVRVWDAATGECLARAEGLAKEILRPVFHPGGGVLAVVQPDGVELFDLPDPLPPLLPRRGKIPATADKAVPRGWFTSDGRFAVLARSGEIRLWSLDPDAEARRRAPRELSPSERDRFEIGTPEERARHRAAEIPASAAALCRRARASAEAGRFDEALDALDRADALRPRYAETALQRAAVLARRAAGRPPGTGERAADADLAVAALREAVARGILRRDPEQGPAGVRGDPRFAALREHPGFEDALSGR